MFICNMKCTREYVDFIKPILMNNFNKSYPVKIGAYIGERLLYTWCIVNKKHIIDTDFVEFKKENVLKKKEYKWPFVYI